MTIIRKPMISITDKEKKEVGFVCFQPYLFICALVLVHLFVAAFSTILLAVTDRPARQTVTVCFTVFLTASQLLGFRSSFGK